MTSKLQPIILIPARMASVRLPGKPLLDIAGKPMIAQVVARALEADIAPVIVACDDARIAEAAEKAGAQAVITTGDHASGSDRILEALEKVDPEKRYNLVINLQGDLPTISPQAVRATLTPFARKEVDIVTLAVATRDEDDALNPNVVKAIVAWNAEETSGKALYFTRACAPAGEGPLYHHIGIYAYRRAALLKFTSLPPSPLEQRERLEQLRALEAGMHIEVVKTDEAPLGVDTPQDLEKAVRLLSG